MTEDKKRLVVIGAVAAGTSAAAKAKREDPEMDVVLLERDKHISYGACGLPYFVSGVISDASNLIARTPEQFRRMGIDVRIAHEVLSIDTANRTVQVADKDGARDDVLHYDHLVMATGATSFRPPVAGLDLPGVFALRTLSEGIALREAILAHKPRSTVIIGGGYIGLEMAEAFRTLGLPVTIVEMAPQLMVNLDGDMSTLLLPEVERNGVRVLLNDGLSRIEGSGHVEKVITQHSEVPADLVLVAIGVRPNTQLAERAGLKLGAGKAIAVDEFQRTSADEVYAAGDCAEATHQVTGEKVYIPLGTTANKQGRVAGGHLAGMSCAFPGVAGTAVVKVFNMQAARTGLTQREALAKGMSVEAVTVVTNDHAGYYPGTQTLHVKLVFDRSSHRLLGAQMVGGGGAEKRIDVLAAALYAKMTVEDLTSLDYSYAPPYASVWDATLVAANVAGRCK
jgi:CoA-dependent NAD(P)H sulfur oxidoreductase